MRHLPKALALADWRRRVAQMYADARARVRTGVPPRAVWQSWRADRDELLGQHSQSSLDAAARAGFAGLPYFGYDAALRFAVEVEPVTGGGAIETDLGADGVIRLNAIGRTSGLARALGKELTLYWIGGYGGGLFLPFTDATSGGETYGGGRYLLDTIKGADLGQDDGRLVIDFNFAYNPSCAYSPVWTCPLAPPENRLPAPVRAGEQARHKAGRRP